MMDDKPSAGRFAGDQTILGETVIGDLEVFIRVELHGTKICTAELKLSSSR